MVLKRLRSREQFQAVLSGKVVSKSHHFALHHLCLDTQQTDDRTCLFPHSLVYVGAMTPKRWAKSAVTRNAIKRQVYSMCDSLKTESANSAFLVRLKQQFSRVDFISAASGVLSGALRREL